MPYLLPLLARRICFSKSKVANWGLVMLLRNLGVCAFLLAQMNATTISAAESQNSAPITPSSEAISSAGHIFPPQSKHVHSSSIVELPDGSLLAAWFQGSGECKADDVRIMGARKASATAPWSEPFLMADTPGHPDCNPVLWLDKNQKLWLFWSAILSNQWDSSLVKYRTSTDYLSTDEAPQWQWQDTVHIKPENFRHQMLSNWPTLLNTVSFLPRALQAEFSNTTFFEFLKDKWERVLLILVILVLINLVPFAIHRWRTKRTGRGGWQHFAMRYAACCTTVATCGALLAVGYFAVQSGPKINQRLGWLTANQPLQLKSGEIVLPLYSDRFVASIMAISSDGGTSWQASRPMVGYGNIQPSLIERSNGQLIALMREAGTRKRIRYCISNNQGHDWSAVKETQIPNPGSKVNVTALENGDWVLAYNNTLDGRHSLQLAISQDEGLSWKPFQSIENAAPGEASFSYPCLTQASDGSLHLTYSSNTRINNKRGETIKHVNIPRQGPLSIATGKNEITRK